VWSRPSGQARSFLAASSCAAVLRELGVPDPRGRYDQLINAVMDDVRQG
jgi:hypothetical protein